MSICRYRVDGDDRLVAIEGDWDRFASANRGNAVEQRKVLGYSLWHFISGLETRLVYRQIMDYVKARRRIVRFLIRCDGPRWRRLLGMRVAPEPGGGCVFETAILLQHAQRTLKLLDTACAKSGETVALCNWCMRMDCGPLGWRALDDLWVRRNVLLQNPPPRPIFTICPDCLTAVRHALR